MVTYKWFVRCFRKWVATAVVAPTGLVRNKMSRSRASALLLVRAVRLVPIVRPVPTDLPDNRATLSTSVDLRWFATTSPPALHKEFAKVSNVITSINLVGTGKSYL